jgi:deazaflavin-dependent oxidoreductase (nitroreductase family)
MTTIRKKTRRTLRYVLRAPVYLYRWRLGRLLGNRFLLLTHTGRHTGIRHQTVLEVMEYRKEGPEALVMSGFGRDADWLLNIEANPNEEVVLGSEHFAAIHRLLGEEEAIEVVKSYESRNRWMRPIVRSVLSRLLGWHYRGLRSGLPGAGQAIAATRIPATILTDSNSLRRSM